MEAMGRKPGWSLLLNPALALLADMGVAPVEYRLGSTGPRVSTPGQL